MTEESPFSRNELLLRRDAIQRLAAARVVIVGLGAVGSYAVEALARAGVGHLRLVDFDEIRPSNMNRHLFALPENYGRNKAEVTAERARKINPACEVEAISAFADERLYPHIFAPPVAALIDACDSVGPKAALLVGAARAGIPIVVSSMGAANRLNPLAVRVARLPRTRNCPLARQIRHRIDQPAVARRIWRVFSEELPYAAPGPLEPPELTRLRRGRARRVLGSSVCVTGVFGLVAAREVIVRLCSRPQNGIASSDSKL